MILPSLRRRFFLLFGCALCFVAGSHLWAQSSDSPLHKNGIKAHSIPLSDTQIVFQVTTPSGQTANMTVPEGGMAKASDSRLGTTYAFVPVLKNVEEKSVDFAVFLVTEDKEGNESIRQLENVTGNIGNAALLQSQPKLQIRLTGVNPPEKQASLLDRTTKPTETKIEMGPAVDCCVYCKDSSACAGAVCIPNCGVCHDPGFKAPDCPGVTSSGAANMPIDLSKHHAKLALSSLDGDGATPAAQPTAIKTKNQQ